MNITIHTSYGHRKRKTNNNIIESLYKIEIQPRFNLTSFSFSFDSDFDLI